MRIFILDTDNQTIDLLKNYLSEMDYLSETLIFSYPEAMLEAYKKERPGMLFIRVGNFKFNGLLITRHVSVIDHIAKVVIISKFKSYADFAWEAGAIDYLLEPFEFERFMEILARAG